MAEVTVKELAKSVGTPVDRLLKQMSEAGLPHKGESENVSDGQKQTLLTFLKKSHGESSDAPKKVTLKRKVVTKLKTGGAGNRSKTVSIEVRKKRTYVKREESAEQDNSAQEAAARAQREAEDKKLAAAQAKAAKDKQSESKAAKPKTDKPKQTEGKEPRKDSKPQREFKKADAKPADQRNKTTRPASRPTLPQSDGDSVIDKKKTRVKVKTKSSGNSSQGDEQKKSRNASNRPQTKNKGNRHQQILGVMDEDAPRGRRRKAKVKRDHQFEKPTAPVQKSVEIGDAISIPDLASQLSIKSAEVVKNLFKMGVVATVNEVLDQDTAILVTEEMGHEYKIVNENAVEDKVMDVDYAGEQVTRAPVVTVMGHVDHGKTSLLDYIRKAKVTDGESGGITQHIGAYHVDTDKGMISFLDTPGHAAFTAMRARGAQATDIVILVVAGDDGVMPQTEEAIQHAKAAGVPIVVAINKMDKEASDPERVTSELGARDVVPEAWGGDTQFVQVSAHTGLGIDDLLEAVSDQAELLELTAYDQGPAKGVVVESRLDKGRGSVSTLLVQSGQLKRGDIVLAGETFGRVRALLDENSRPIDQAGPSLPVEVLGLDGTPDAGDEFTVVSSEKQAREVASFRREKHKVSELARQKKAKLDNLFSNMEAGETSSLNVVIKTDVRGSLEAISASLQKIGNEEVSVNIVSAGVGAISESDANLAITSGAVMFGFNVRAAGKAREIIEQNNVDLRYYNVIYDIIDDVKSALSGMLSPELREEIVGYAEVKDVFNSPKFGQIAGSMVVEGTIYKNKKIRVLRDEVVIYEGELESLRRFKDDVENVRQGTECGIGVKNYTDVKVGDKIEVFEVKEIARTID